jgi:ABC-2 type transport system permease protein
MNTFKAALRVAATHKLYFIIYLLALSLCGLSIIFVGTGGGSGTHESFDANIAVIDRDGSAISEGLRDHIGQTANLVALDDDTQAIQDALAQSTVDAVIVVDDGFGGQLMDAAHEGNETPSVDVAYGTDMESGALAVGEATSWLSLVGRAAALDPSASDTDAVASANDVGGEEATVQLTDVQTATGGTDSFASYLGFNSYSVFVTIVVCAGLVMVRFRRKEVRERSQASPVSPGRINRSVIAAGLVLMAITWAWVSLVAIAFAGDILANATGTQVAISLASLLTYCLVPLALAFTLSQLNASEQMLNAIGNIFGLVSAFFSGAWIPLDLVGTSVQTLAKFTPAYWFNDALVSVFSTGNFGAVSGRIGTDFAMLVLFAVVTALIGVAASRVSIQHSVGASRKAAVAH